MAVGNFEPPPRFATKSLGRLPDIPKGTIRGEDLQGLMDFLRGLEDAVFMSRRDEDELRSWLHRYTKKVAAET